MVDVATDDEFHSQLISFKEIWDRRETESTGRDPEFHGWFLCNCADVVRKNMLKPVRVAAGLGSPPSPFYTNAVESLNKVAKMHTNYQKQTVH